MAALIIRQSACSICRC